MCIYGYSSPMTPTTAPASAVGAVRRGSTITTTRSRSVPENTNGPAALAKGPVRSPHSPQDGEAFMRQCNGTSAYVLPGDQRHAAGGGR